MSGIASIGQRERVQGFSFAGVTVVAADGADAVRAAWAQLPNRVKLVILTEAAHAALDAEQLAHEDAPLAVVMPR
jgi:vacuolar-type H+-ATPase subunit F/Vma7